MDTALLASFTACAGFLTVAVVQTVRLTGVRAELTAVDETNTRLVVAVNAGDELNVKLLVANDKLKRERDAIGAVRDALAAELRPLRAAEQKRVKRRAARKAA